MHNPSEQVCAGSIRDLLQNVWVQHTETFTSHLTKLCTVYIWLIQLLIQPHYDIITFCYKCGWKHIQCTAKKTQKWCFTRWPWIMWISNINLHTRQSATPWQCSQQQVTEQSVALHNSISYTLMKTGTQPVVLIISTSRAEGDIGSRKKKNSAESSCQPKCSSHIIIYTIFKEVPNG